MLSSKDEKKIETIASAYQRLAILLDFNQCISHENTTEQEFIRENRPLLDAIEKATQGIKDCVLYLFTKQSFMEVDLSMVLRGNNGSCLPFYQWIQKYFTDKGIPLKLDMTMLQDQLSFEKEGTTAQKILQMVTADSKSSVTYPARYYPMEKHLFYWAIDTEVHKTKRAHFYHYIHKAAMGLPAGAQVLCHVFDNDKTKLSDWQKWLKKEEKVPPPNFNIVFNKMGAGSKGPQFLGQILTKSTNQADINYLYHTVTFLLDHAIDITKNREKPLSDDEISQCKKQVITVLIQNIKKYYYNSNNLPELLNTKNETARSLQEVTFLLELIKQFIDSIQFYYVSGKAKPLDPALAKLCGQELWSAIIGFQEIFCKPAWLKSIESLVDKLSEVNEKRVALKDDTHFQKKVDAEVQNALIALRCLYYCGEDAFRPCKTKLDRILAEIEARKLVVEIAKTSSTKEMLSIMPPLDKKEVSKQKELASVILLEQATVSEKSKEKSVKEMTATVSHSTVRYRPS